MQTKRFISVALLVFMGTQAPALEFKYDEFQEVSTKKCVGTKVAGKKIQACMNPGDLGGGVKGVANILTISNEETSEVGAVAMVEQDFVVEIFGKKAEITASCSFNSKMPGPYELFIGYELRTPEIPSVSVLDILTREEGKASKSAASKKPASQAPSSSNQKHELGQSDYQKVFSSDSVGCTFSYPDVTIFSGVDEINVAEAGSKFVLSFDNWQIDSSSGSVSVTFTASVEPTAGIGGGSEKVCVGKKPAKVCEKVKIPGYHIRKDVSLLNEKLGP